MVKALEGHSFVFLVGMASAKHQNGGLKTDSFVKVRSKELKIFNILRPYELIFESNLGCRAENSSNFWQTSLLGVKIWYFSQSGV